MKNKKNIKPYLISSTAAFVLAVGAGSFLPQKIEAYAHKPSDYKSSYANTHTAYAINIKFPFCHAKGTKNEKLLMFLGGIFLDNNTTFFLATENSRKKKKLLGYKLASFLIDEWKSKTKKQNPKNYKKLYNELILNNTLDTFRIETFTKISPNSSLSDISIYFDVRVPRDKTCNNTPFFIDIK